MSEKFHGLLGMAQRAGAVISGTLPCTKSLRKGKGVLLIVAADAALEVQKEAKWQAEQANVPLLIYSTKVELGAAIGKSLRALVLITDPGFAGRLKVLSQ